MRVVWASWHPAFSDSERPFRVSGVGEVRTLDDLRTWVYGRAKAHSYVWFVVRVAVASDRLTGSVSLYDSKYPTSFGDAVGEGTLDEVWPVFVAHGRMLEG